MAASPLLGAREKTRAPIRRRIGAPRLSALVTLGYPASGLPRADGRAPRRGTRHGTRSASSRSSEPDSRARCGARGIDEVSFAVPDRHAGKLEAAPGFEPGNKGFADPRLTTWLCRHPLG